MNHVCLFFCVNGIFLVHGCSLQEAELYGDFLIYPQSHFDIWEQHYASIYPVDFDYYPRGRVVYRQSDKTFQIYSDGCLESVIREWAASRYSGPVCFARDEHYQCHRCNTGYVV